MPAILAIDTSSEGCSVAVSIHQKTTAIYLDSPRQHTQKLLPLVDKLLSQCDMSLSDLDGIAYGKGPGSFTGLRIGLGVSQGLAYSVDLPVYGVSSLWAMAEEVVAKGLVSNGGLLLCATDARMSEIYWAVYRWQDHKIHTVMDEQLTSPDELSRLLQHSNIELEGKVGTGCSYPEVSAIASRFSHIDQHPRAEFMIPMALAMFDQGAFVAADQAELTYLRDSVAWKKRVRIRNISSSS